MDNNDRSKLIGRRQTLQMFGAGLSASSFMLLAACGSKSGGDGSGATGGPAGGNDCNTPLTADAKSKRKLLQYADKAAIPANHCSVCAQYVKGQYGECGGCKVIPGPVKPDGGCLSFAPLDDAGAAGSAKAPG